MILSADEHPPASAMAAVKANWAEFYTHLGRAPAAELSVGPHLSWLLTGVADSFMNVVFRTDLQANVLSDVVDEALLQFRSRGISRLSWWADMAAADCGPYLLRRGLVPRDGGSAMAADLRSIDDGRLPSGLEIVLVDDRARLMAWVEVMRVGFGLPASSIGQLVELFEPIALQPPMTTYLGLLDGQPVATSQLFLGASVAGLYNITCLPGARGRGIGSALTRRPMVDARQLGFELVILQASQLGFPVYRRLGFEDLGRLPFYELDSVMASRS